MFTFVYVNKREVELDVPLEAGATRQSFDAIADHWRGQLRRVAFDVRADPRIGDTIRTSLAYMLIHRDGDALQPGSRSYERAWIRDGALMAATLLRLGHAEDAKRFAEWFAKYQYEDGRPCCVDRRADPCRRTTAMGTDLPHCRDLRLTHGAAFVKRMWLHVDAAAAYVDKLRPESWQFEGWSRSRSVTKAIPRNRCTRIGMTSSHCRDSRRGRLVRARARPARDRARGERRVHASRFAA